LTSITITLYEKLTTDMLSQIDITSQSLQLLHSTEQTQQTTMNSYITVVTISDRNIFTDLSNNTETLYSKLLH